jgi:FSR family fosmidomycin resistance protein-like MFS transporter
MPGLDRGIAVVARPAVHIERDRSQPMTASAAETHAPSLDASSNETPPRFVAIKNRALMTLALGHFTVDMYSGMIPILYPLFTDKFDLSLSRVGFISLAYSGASSLSQPFFGFLADKRGTRFIGLALMWTAMTYSFFGFAPTFESLLILAAFSGLGSGLYHPLGALNARAVIDERYRNISMSLYVTGGTLGVASGPLVGALLTHFFGLHGTALMIVPGGSIAIVMLVQMKTISQRVVRHAKSTVSSHETIPYRTLAIVIAMMALRSWTISGLQNYVPSWYKDLGYSSFFYGALVTTLLLSTALGTVGSGSLADKYGRRFPIIVSAILSVPTILIFAQYPGNSAFVWIALIGFLAASTMPLLLVIAQELMTGRAGLATGLVLGLGFATSAVGVPITGAIADHWGIQNAMRGQAIIGLASVAVALFLPTEAAIRAIVARQTGAAAA